MSICAWTECELAYCACITVVNGEGKPGKKRYENTTLERRILPMCSDDTMDDGITDLVLNFCFVHGSAMYEFHKHFVVRDNNDGLTK